MKWEFDNDRPIYVQIVEQLKIRIITHTYPPGSKLPSVRDLSMETKVNPNTMQKALGELESAGLIYTQRTNGKYVTDDVHIISKEKEALIEEYMQAFLQDMTRLELTTEEIISYIRKEEKQ